MYLCSNIWPFLDASDGTESKKRHVYAIVEGESPHSTPPSTPNDKETNRIQKMFPKIFPRSQDLCNEETNSSTSLSSSFDDKSSIDFHKVTLI